MANKITIQHYYTTGSTAPASLELGEIAIAHSGGSEAIYIKNGVKFIPESQIDKKFEDAGIASNGVITGLSAQLESHITSKASGNTLGHVKLVQGDLSGITALTTGEAAASYHTHGQYLKNVNAVSGLELAGIIDGEATIRLTQEARDQLEHGETAYGWGNHASIGYAQNSALTAHTNNGDIHVTKTQKDDWDKAKSDIDAFMAAAESGTTALDTLKEIQDFLTSDDGTVQTLLDNLTDLTDKVTGNTADINELKERTGEVQAASPNIAVELVTGGTVNLFRVYHTTAGTQTSEIKATNTSTDLSFGSGFTIVNNIGYDVNGHVVSGSTQTLNLPSLPYAETGGVYGIVTLLGGDVDAEPELGQATKSTAAHFQHTHGNYTTRDELARIYATKADLGMTISNGITTISCGTY